MFGIDSGKGNSIVIWLILGVLALAFGLTFGLPSDQLSMGESGLVKVHGINITRDDFAYQQRVISSVFPLPEGEQAQGMGVREEVLEAVVERLVLTDVGGELGLMTETHDAELNTLAGYYMVLDLDRPYPWAGGTKFDFKLFKSYLGNMFLVSESRYYEIQRQELLARQVRDLVSASVAIPEAEIWKRYESENNQLSLRYVRISHRDYAELVDPSAEDVDGWMAEHEAELGEMYEREANRFLKLPAEVDLRFIEVAKPLAPPEDAGEEVQALWTQNLADARAEIEAARTAIIEGGESFPALARRMSDNVDTARSGGRYGWTQITDTGSGLDRAIDEAAQALEDGQISELIEGERAFYLVTLAGHREGDVPEADAKREIATEAVRSARGRELAQRSADEALLAIREGKDIDDVFTAKPVLGGEGGVEGGIETYGEARDLTPKYEVQETGLFNRGATIPGVGNNPILTDAAWETDLAEPLIDQVFEVPGGLLLAVLDERQEATDEGYAAARPAIYDALAAQRGGAVLSAFTKQRCFLGKATVDIRVNKGPVDRLMSYDGNPMVDAEGIRLTPPYHVCDRVGDSGGLLRIAMMRGGGM